MTNMTPALVDRLRAAPTEDQHLEFKEARTAFDKEKLRDYCVALANEGGGYLVLGVSNDLVGRARAVIGTRAFPRPIELERYILESCKFRVDVGEVVHPDGRVIVVSIPSRPRGVPLEAGGRYLMRAGESLVAMSQDRLRQISNPGEPIVDANRFIDGYQSRNEHLAELMRSFGICEEKGSGVDRVIAATEESLLPAPDFRVGHHRTHVLVFGPREFSETTLEERIRACFQHCALRWVNGGHMTNQSLRARFRLPEDKSSSVSQVIGAAVDAKLVKLDKSVGASKRHARYIPFWA